MNKKILISTVVIISGLMLGIIFSDFYARKDKSIEATSPQTSNTTPANSILESQENNQIILSASPKETKVISPTTDVKKDLDTIEKITLSFKLEDDSINLKGAQIKLFHSSKVKVGFSGTENTKLINQEASASEPTFDIAQGANPFHIYTYAYQEGTITVYGEIKTSTGQSIKTNDVKLVFK